MLRKHRYFPSLHSRARESRMWSVEISYGPRVGEPKAEEKILDIGYDVEYKTTFKYILNK